MDTAYVLSNGQLIIPAWIRQKLGIKPGTKVSVVEQGNDILLRPITKKYIHGMSGMLKFRTSVTKGLLKERKKDRAREESKIEKHGA